MSSLKTYLEKIISELSNWIKGFIALVTALVSFAILFHNNPDLTVVFALLIISIAALVSFGYILRAKTKPLVIGGRGVFKYQNLHLFAKIGIGMVLLSNLAFFLSSLGQNMVEISIKGTPTPIPTPTPTQLPSILFSLETKYFNDQCGYLWEIPTNWDIHNDLQGTLKKIIEWDKGDRDELNIITFHGDMTMYVTGMQKQDDIPFIINNTAKIVIDSVTPLEHMDVVFPGHGYSCGGGGIPREFPAVNLVNENNIETQYAGEDADYFTLERGEVEAFKFSFYCGEAGIYMFHVEMDAFQGEKNTKISSTSVELKCPGAYSRWETNLSQNALSYEREMALSQDKNDKDRYIRVPKINNEPWYYVEAQGWQHCENAPLSYIYEASMFDDRLFVTSSLDTFLVVRQEPGINQPVVTYLEPGELTRSFGGGPECADGMVWWEVYLWDYEEDYGHQDYLYTGWVAEGDENDRWLIPCFESTHCD